MPITANKVNLREVIQSWFSKENDYTTVISSLQNETRVYTISEIYGSIVLLTSQMETISVRHKVPAKEKYEYPIKKFGSLHLHEILCETLACTDLAKLGVAIGNLRGDIAHVGRPLNYINKLTTLKLLQVSECMRLIVIGFILSEIGIPFALIEKYQDHFALDRLT
ncbi:hypothetical protein GCM10007386_05120 [Pseudoduganella dura]|nr:hypothetical protein GCM10007386_05120 [Pseudoduganella dura]